MQTSCFVENIELFIDEKSQKKELKIHNNLIIN